MSGIAVIHSTLCPNALREYVATHYDVGPPESCRLLKRGWNDSYEIVTANDRFILRIYSAARSQSEVAYEIGLISHIHSRGVSVSVPVPSRSGLLTLRINAPEGRREAALFTYAHGNVPPMSDARQMARFGALSASVHDAGGAYVGSRSLDVARLLDGPARAAAAHLHERPKDRAFFEALVERLRERLDEDSEADIGPCHGDLHTGNVRGSSSEMTLFDFDFCGEGFRAYDLASFASVAYMKRTKAPLRSFLAGYEGVRPLDPAVVGSIPIFMIVRFIWLVGIRAAKNMEAGEGWIADYLDAWLATLRRLSLMLDAAPPERAKDLLEIIPERDLVSRIRSKLSGLRAGA